MTDQLFDVHFEEHVRKRWNWPLTEKARRYVGAFTDRVRLENGVFAKVKGNHGVYKVSIYAEKGSLASTCTCYIGEHGYCHHCEALAHTFLRERDTFIVHPIYAPSDMRNAHTSQQIHEHLQGMKLQDVMNDLRKMGMQNKDIATMLGIKQQRLSVILKREMQFGHSDDLIPLKLACLWLVDHFSYIKQTHTTNRSYETAG